MAGELSGRDFDSVNKGLCPTSKKSVIVKFC